MPTPLVSVLTPTFNQEKFLVECIKSVQAQTFRDWEQIVIDDGSTDGTQDVMRKIVDHRVTYIRQKHMGIERLYQTYNRALKECKAPLVAILEGDDFWPPYKLDLQLSIFRDKTRVLSYGHVAHTDRDSRIISKGGRFSLRIPHDRHVLFNDPPGNILRRLVFDNFIPAVTVVLVRDMLECIGGFKQPRSTVAVDYATWLDFSLKGRFSYIPQVLGFSRRHPSSVTLQLSKDPAKAIDVVGSYMSYARAFLLGAKADGTLKEDLWYLIEALVRHSKRYNDLVYFTYARTLLMDKKWHKADSVLRRLVHSKWHSIRFASLAALLASKLHTNVELPLRLFGVYPLEQ